jgi:V8-like Glu-specific endopeptidase
VKTRCAPPSARIVSLVAVAVAFAASCACEPREEREVIARGAAAVVGGTTDDSDAAVVAIVARRTTCGEVPSVICSGTLIAPRVVLTAAHCLASLGPGASSEVMFGARAGASARYVLVTAVAAHPAYDRVTHAYDVAVLRLSDDPGVPPLPLALASSPLGSGDVGATARVVGYGVSGADASDVGVKRTGTTKIATVDVASFTLSPSPSMTCSGDSGGPVFLTRSGDAGSVERVVGVTVSGDPACSDHALNVRVDAVALDFVQPFIDTTARTSAGVPPGAMAEDALCDAPCKSDVDCPSALACIAIGDQRRCVLPGAMPASFGASCVDDATCGGATCARLSSSGSRACACAAACGVGRGVPEASTFLPTSGDASGCSITRRGPRHDEETAWAAIVIALAVIGARRLRRPTLCRSDERAG